ncbi:uncharacterized protein VNE69_01336 [Vairimorpha necatrix]|uniref:Uncharacterized protein n=1 Tax=Vairimorpha necatrix TaxID=6039 RepID=A0AAX4J8U1_9MICR
MHEFIFSTKTYKITAYLKNSTNSNITIHQCLEIKSKIALPELKGFKNSGNLYFPNSVLKNSDNQIFALVIDFCKEKNIRKIFNKILPSVFDMKYIKDKNREYFLYINRYLIIKMAKNILGDEEIIKETWKMLCKNNNNISFVDFSDDIFENEIVLKSDDLIDF